MPKFNPLIRSLKKPEHKACIYALLDPDTREVRYVGQTRQGFARIIEHYYKCDKVNRNTKQYSAEKRWCSKLKKNNKIFIVEYLEYVNEELLNEREQFYIKQYRKEFNLLNHQDGGTNNGVKLTEEARKKISDATRRAMKCPEIIEKCRQHAYKTVAGYNKGKKFSDDFKQKISKSQDHKVLVFVTDDGSEFRTYKEFAKHIGCSISAINHFVNGRCKTIYGKVYKYRRGV